MTNTPSQLRPAVPPWTVRRVGSDAARAMAHHGDAVSSLAPDPSPMNGQPVRRQTTLGALPSPEVESVSVGAKAPDHHIPASQDPPNSAEQRSNPRSASAKLRSVRMAE